MSDPNPQSCRVAIVGGGISGLAAAHRLSRACARDGLAPRMRLFDAAPRLGGQVCTVRHDGLLLECGPDSLVTQKPAGIELCRELGLADELMYPGSAPIPMRLLHRDRLIGVPPGFLMMAPTRWGPLLRSPLFSWPGKLRMAAERLVRRRPTDWHDESVGSFVTRRFGREVFERVAEPIIGGLFTADASRLSLRMTMPRFLELEERHGSVTIGLKRMMRRHRGAGGRPGHHVVTLRHGMQGLVERLAATLEPDSIATGVAVERIEYDRLAARWRVVSAPERPFMADALILACPAHVSANLLRATDAVLAERLGVLRYASCATVNLVYDGSAVATPLDSYGFFVPRTANAPIIACNFSSIKFDGRAPEGKVLLRGFLGGATNPAVLELDDAEMIRIVHDTLARILRIEGRPLLARVHRAPFSMPQYDVGHTDHLRSLVERLTDHPSLFLCGTPMGAVGLPDCIASGERAGDAAARLAVARSRSLELAI